VRQALADLRAHGAGLRYLIQHSAGSGKSNSIAWLAHQLIGLKRDGDAAGGEIFDSVIVVTDRRILDSQIQATIRQFMQVGATVGHAESSGDLRKFIQEGKKIIVSTVQKFPFILDEIATEAGRHFAIIIDEAHSSQGGKTFDTRKANTKLRRYVESHAHAIRLKTEIMVDHFHAQVLAAGKIGGQARAMVVTSGIARAIQYFHAFQAYLRERKSPYQAIVAFSGEHEVGGAKVSEASLNGFASGDIARQIRTDPYRFLICADKFQTGYDEPLLHTMYVDKLLAGIKAVQTLSRLNRGHPQKHDCCVLDFQNNSEAITYAFQDYYRTTLLADETDPNRLHDLKAALDAAQVYSPEQVRQVVAMFLDGADRDQLDPILDACVAVYVDALDEDGQVDFKGKARVFCRSYAFLSSVIAYRNAGWEKLSIFLDLLTPRLPAPQEEDLARGILEAIDMDSYRVEKQAAMNIALADQDAEIEPLPTDTRGHQPEPEMDRLSNILKTFNEQFGTLFTDGDRVAKRIREDIAPKVAADAAYRNARENTPHTARMAHDQALGKVMQILLKDDTQVYKQFVENESLHLVHRDAELVDFAELADDVLHGGGEDIDTAHRDHVVGAAEDAALEAQEAAAAAAAVEVGPDQVAGAVADYREAPAPEVGQHQFAALARGDRLAALRVDHLRDVLALDQMRASGVLVAFEGMGADLRGAGVVETLCRPGVFDALLGRGNAGAGLAGVHRGSHRYARQVEAEFGRHLGQAQGVGRRAAEHGGAGFAHQLQALLRIAAAAGNHHRADLPRALDCGPEADEGTEGEGHEQAVGSRHPGAGKHVAPAAPPPVPGLVGVHHLERYAGGARGLVHAHVSFDRVGQVAAEGTVGRLVGHQFSLFGQGQARQVVQGADVGGLDARGLPLVGVEEVAAPKFGQHRLQLA
jgi:hypothetical protein